MRCLILHGLAGSPFEVRPVADALEAAGHIAVCPVLPGHAASEEEYLASSYTQWLDCARAAYLDQYADGPVLLAGYSLGGLLALNIAAEAAEGRLPAPAGLLLLATPLFLWRLHPLLFGRLAHGPAAPVVPFAACAAGAVTFCGKQGHCPLARA
ncbi:MAG: alpha/beta fold hydrolase [Desulfovibrio sp.]